MKNLLYWHDVVKHCILRFSARQEFSKKRLQLSLAWGLFCITSWDCRDRQDVWYCGDSNPTSPGSPANQELSPACLRHDRGG